jgi:hypothetical protein
VPAQSWRRRRTISSRNRSGATSRCHAAPSATRLRLTCCRETGFGSWRRTPHIGRISPHTRRYESFVAFVRRGGLEPQNQHDPPIPLRPLSIGCGMSAIFTPVEAMEPCPFCGKEAVGAHLAGSAWFIDARHTQDCHFADFQRSETDAITAWNTRAQPTLDRSGAIRRQALVNAIDKELSGVISPGNRGSLLKQARDFLVSFPTPLERQEARP